MRSSLVSRPAVAVAGPFVLLLALLLVDFGAMGTQASLSGGMDAMSIDVDVTGNTATSLGPLDSCVEARAGDVVTVDVTALNIPATNPMIAFTYAIQYDDSSVRVESQDDRFLLAANAGSGLVNASDSTPDENVNGLWSATVLDVSDSRFVPPEFGNGVLSRLSISIRQGLQAGLYTLRLAPEETAHVDTNNDTNRPEILNSAAIAVGVSCPPVSGTPTPVPSPTPLPTPTPGPPAISVGFEPEAQLRPGENSVTISGTITCSLPGSVDIQVLVQQFVKGARVLAVAPASNPIACDGQTSWRATMQPEFGRFRPGYGEATVIAHASGFGSFGTSGPVHLKPGALK